MHIKKGERSCTQNQRIFALKHQHCKVKQHIAEKWCDNWFVSPRTQVQKNPTSKLRYLYPWDAGGVGKVWTKYCTKYKKQHRQSCSSERHENIHTPIPLHTNTHKAFHIQYSPYLPLPCPPITTSTTHRHTNLSWHFSFSHGHTLCCCPTDANLILGYPSHPAVMLCSSLTFLLLRWWCIWTGQSCVCGKWFRGPAWDN